MTGDQEEQLLLDVSQIKKRLIGCPEYQEKGFIQETCEQLDSLQKFKRETEKLKIKITGVAIGASGVFSILVWLIDKLIKK